MGNRPLLEQWQWFKSAKKPSTIKTKSMRDLPTYAVRAAIALKNFRYKKTLALAHNPHLMPKEQMREFLTTSVRFNFSESALDCDKV